jgi:hypothetical protein
MIPKECRRLAEVDFPIAVVSKRSAREKSIRHGHPSTLHLLVGALAAGGLPSQVLRNRRWGKTKLQIAQKDEALYGNWEDSNEQARASGVNCRHHCRLP